MSQAKFDRFSREAENGRFLIRPFGGLGAVYNVDTEAKEKFLKYRKISGLPAILIFLVTSLMGMPPIPVLVLLCAWFTVDIGVRLRYVRRGHKVDRKLWTPLPNMDTGPLFPRWAYLIFVPVLLVLEWASLGSIWNLYAIGYPAPIESWVLVALWTFLLYLSWGDIRKKPTITKSPAFVDEAGPEETKVTRRDDAA